MATQTDDPLVGVPYILAQFPAEARPPKRAVYKWIATGGIPKPDCRLGKRIFWRKSHLDAELIRNRA